MGLELLGNVTGLTALAASMADLFLPPIMEPCLAGVGGGEPLRPGTFAMMETSGSGGGGGRRSLFDSLFSEKGPPEIRDPGFLPAVARLAPPVDSRKVRVLFAEGPGEPVPSVRFVTTIPSVAPGQVAPLVSSEITRWAEWIPMLAAIEVYRDHDADRGEIIQRLVMRMEGLAAKMVGMGTVSMVHRMEEEVHGEVAQSRWELVDREDEEGDLVINRGSWTFAPYRNDGVTVVYEGHQVPRFLTRQNRLMRAATVAGMRRHTRGHLRELVEHLAHRSADPSWTKRSSHRPLNVEFILEDV